MFGFTKSRPCSIGVDVSGDSVRVVQLAENGKELKLLAGRFRNRPNDVEPGSSNWQKWAIQSIRLFTSSGDFSGKNVTAAIPASDLFIDHVRVSRANDDKLDDVVFGKIKSRLPFEAVREKIMMKCIRTDDENVLVMAAERKIIDRHLAIYEEANLSIKTIGVWPLALINCYTRFFGRRKSDIEAVVMLISMESDSTNVVICRHNNLLFARSISIGAKHFDEEGVTTRLALELDGCRRQFNSMHRNSQIERLIFLTGRDVDREICATIARQLEMPAQTGDCLAAVEIADPNGSGIDRRIDASDATAFSSRQQQNWATAFGLSLS
jgi:Tfp pilus assembly PilM family ATPase